MQDSNLDIKLFVTELSDIGPQPVAVSLDDMFDDEMEQETFLLRYGAYFMSILGQSEEKFTGLFGPLPVHGFYDSLSYLFAFEVKDPNLTDERLEGQAYCILALFFKKAENAAMNFLRNYIEAALWKFVSKATDIEGIKEEGFLNGIKETIRTVYNDTSIERTESKVIIRKRIENAVTKSEVKVGLENLKDKLKWVIVTDPISGDFPITVETMLSLLADQVKKYEQKGNLQLADGKIQANIISSDQIPKKPKELSHSNGVIITMASTTKGIKTDNPNIETLRQALAILQNEKSKFKVAIAIEGEVETSAPFEMSVASISASIDAQLLFANPISFFPIHRDFPEQMLKLIAFLLREN